MHKVQYIHVCMADCASADMQGKVESSYLGIHTNAWHMAHHYTTDVQLLKGIPYLVQIMREHARLQPILAVIHAACPYGLVRPVMCTILKYWPSHHGSL